MSTAIRFGKATAKQQETGIMTAKVRTIKVLACVAATACMTAANVWTANAAIIETYVGVGNFNTAGSAAQTARNAFLARLIPATVTSNVFNVTARQDNYNVTTLTFGNYAAGTGAYSADVGSLMRAELNRGTGFIFRSGNGLDLVGSGLSGGWATTMGAELGSPPNADLRYNNVCPAFIANRANYIGISPIEGTTGNYNLLTDNRAFGVSIGRWNGEGVMMLSFFL